MNYEEIGKQAVKAGYDGGGVWTGINAFGQKHSAWKSDEFYHQLANCWPDFSYPETEGAALAWIAEKIDSGFVYMTAPENEGWRVACGRTKNPSYIGSWSSVREEALLSAIKSLSLSKKDNSLVGLNKRLLEVGFRKGGCRWIDTGNGSRDLFYHDVTDLSVYFCWTPDGSNPSTIGVATAWLRSFEKIGDSLHFYYDPHMKAWRYSLYDAGEGQFASELEALVEFAEWAKEEGLLK